MDLFFQLFGMALMFGGIAAGYHYWVRPHSPLDTQQRGLLLLVLLTLMGGLVGGLAWWWDDSRSFAWNLPPLASRMLASAGWAFALVSALALQRPTPRALRLILILLFVYLVPLTVAIVFFHLDRFDFAQPISYGFFTIVLTMVISSLWYLARQPIILPDDPLTPPHPLTRLWLLGVALILGIWGAALFATSQGDSALIWVWTGDLLTSRLIGVMLLTIATGALYSLNDQRVARLTLAFMAFYGLGVVLANGWNTLADKPIKWSYVVAFGVIGVVSSGLLAKSPPHS